MQEIDQRLVRVIMPIQIIFIDLICKPEDQWSYETLTWYLGQAQNKIWFKMAQSFLRKANFQM